MLELLLLVACSAAQEPPPGIEVLHRRAVEEGRLGEWVAGRPAGLRRYFDGLLSSSTRPGADAGSLEAARDLAVAWREASGDGRWLERVSLFQGFDADQKARWRAAMERIDTAGSRTLTSDAEAEGTIPALEESARTLHDLGDPIGEAMGRHAVGRVHCWLHDSAAAEVEFQKVRELAGGSGDEEGTGHGAFGLAVVRREQGRRQEAADLAGAAAELYRRSGSMWKAAWASVLQGRDLWLTGRRSEGLALIEKGIPEVTGGSDRVAVATALQFQALSCLESRRYGDAVATVERASRLIGPRDGPEAGAILLHLKETVALHLGRIEEAAELARRTLDQARATGRPGLVASSLQNLGVLETILGHLEESYELHRKARSLADRPALEEIRFRSTLSLSRVAIELERLDEAERFLAEARRIARDTGQPGREAAVLCLKSLLLERQGGEEGVRKVLDEAQTAAERAGTEPLLLAEIRQNLARLLARAGRAAEALDLYEKALEILDGPDRRPLEEALRVGLVESRTPAFKAAFRTAVKHGSLERGLRCLERGRARVLAELLARGGAAAPAPEIASLEALQSALPDGAACLLYDLDEEGDAFLIVVRRTAARVLNLGRADTVASEARAALEVFRDRRSSPAAVAKAGRSLHRLLLAPAGKDLEATEEWTVVPDGALHLLPFEGLVEPGDPPARFEDIPFVVRRRSVSYAPSATVLLELLRRPASTAPKVLALVSEAGSGPDLKPLSGVAGEAAALRRLVPGALHLAGDDARAEALGARPLSSYRYLHFACHGRFDPDQPDRSGLLLAGGTRLGIAGAAALRLDAELVTLSACESAAGRATRLEGLLALPRAFLLAGARRVLATGWEVDDPAAAVLMELFYSGLLDGKSPGEALRRAKLDFLDGAPAGLTGGGEARGDRPQGIRGERPASPAHPFYWAAFFLVGPSR